MDGPTCRSSICTAGPAATVLIPRALRPLLKAECADCRISVLIESKSCWPLGARALWELVRTRSRNGRQRYQHRSLRCCSIHTRNKFIELGLRLVFPKCPLAACSHPHRLNGRSLSPPADLGAMFALVILILYRGISLLMPRCPRAASRLRRFKNLLMRQAHGVSVAKLHLEIDERR